MLKQVKKNKGGNITTILSIDKDGNMRREVRFKYMLTNKWY